MASATLSDARATADVEEVGGLAAGALDQVHGGHGQAGAVDHAADVAVEADEGEAGRAGLDVGGVLLVEVAHLLVAGVSAEGGVVERDLGVEQLQRLDRAVGAVFAHDRQRVDLDQVGVLVDHHLDQAGADGGRLLEVVAEAQRGRPSRAPGRAAGRAVDGRGP